MEKTKKDLKRLGLEKFQECARKRYTFAASRPEFQKKRLETRK